MIFIKAFFEVYFTLWFHAILFGIMLGSFGISLDPYATPEHNLAFLMFSLIPILFWIWQYLTRNEEIRFWQIF